MPRPFRVSQQRSPISHSSEADWEERDWSAKPHQRGRREHAVRGGGVEGRRNPLVRHGSGSDPLQWRLARVLLHGVRHTYVGATHQFLFLPRFYLEDTLRGQGVPPPVPFCPSP